jgi:hypothetical protein
LTVEYDSHVPSPATWANDLESRATTIDGSAADESRLERASKEAAKAGAKGTRAWIQKVAASGRGEGSTASKIATRINKSRIGQKVLDIGGKVSDGEGKFRPHGRGKASDKVVKTARTAQWAAMVIGPALDLGGVIDAQAKRKQIDDRRKRIKAQLDDEARTARSALAESGTQWINAWVSKVEQSLSDLTNQGIEISAERDHALREIERLRLEATELTKIARGA